MQPGQPAADGLVTPYLRALLAGAGKSSRALRPLLDLRIRRLARGFVPYDRLSAADGQSASALEHALWGEGIVKVFTANLFTPPSAIAVAHEVSAFRPDRLVLVPPSPLFSGGLNGFALNTWQMAAKGAGLETSTSNVCCYPTDAAVLRSLAEKAEAVLLPDGSGSLLLVAPGTGLPDGDPLVWQMQHQARELSRLLELPSSRIGVASLPVSGFDDGGLPSVEQAIRRSRAPALAILPLSPWPLLRAQWGDYLEEWRDLAAATGILSLTLAEPTFSRGADLAPLVRQALAGRPGICAGFGRRLCPDGHSQCPHRRMAVAAMQGKTMA